MASPATRLGHENSQCSRQEQAPQLGQNGNRASTSYRVEQKKNKQRVQVCLYAKNLKKCSGALGGSSDPFAVVTHLARTLHDDHVVLGRTETIQNCLNPVWTKTFDLDYEFGQETMLNVGIYYEVRRKNRDKPMGTCVFEVGDILGTRGNIKAKKIRNNGGVLYARVETLSNNAAASGDLHLQLKGIHLKNVEGGLRGISDPFFEIAKQWDDPNEEIWRVIYRSEFIKNNLSPQWNPCIIPLDRLHSQCRPQTSTLDEEVDCVKKTKLQIRLFDFNCNKAHKAMGMLETSVQALLDANPLNASSQHTDKEEFILRNEGSKKNVGSLEVVTIDVRASPEKGDTLESPPSPPLTAPTSPATPTSPKLKSIKGWRGSKGQLKSPSNNNMSYVARPPSRAYSAAEDEKERPLFIDYISGGCELNMCVAIDFTGSNGDPRIPGTLHYINPDRSSLNEYETAMMTVGSFIAKYDAGQRFPVWGFGAKFNSPVNHCFQVGPPEADGLRGVLEAYRSVFQKSIAMSGPTDFCEVIKCAHVRADRAQEEAMRHGRQAYTVLLILTDGSVTDVEKTKRSLFEASQSPLSIVIVGLGNEDFTKMNFLDNSDPLPPGRDIAHFVEFRHHRDNHAELAQETLEEIPVQLVDYFFSRGMMPLSSVGDNDEAVEPEDCDETVDIDLNLAFNDCNEEIHVVHDSNASQNYNHAFNEFAAVAPPPLVHENTAYANPTGSPTPPSYPQSLDRNPPPASPYHARSNSQPLYQNERSPRAGSSPLSPSSTSNHVAYGQSPHRPVSYKHYSQGNFGHEHGQPYETAQAPLPPTMETLNLEPRPLHAAQSQPLPFGIQVSDGMSPGSQVQVIDPRTGELLVVTVPMGVVPGSTFYTTSDGESYI